MPKVGHVGTDLLAIVTTIPAGVDAAARYPLGDALSAQGFMVEFLDPLDLHAGVDHRAGLDAYAAFVIRTPNSDHLPALQDLLGDRRCVNSISAMADAADKWRIAQCLAAAGLAGPRTALADSGPEVEAALQRLGRPALLKPRRGHGGSGIIAVEDAETVAGAVHGSGLAITDFILQEFVAVEPRHDYRAFVVGRRVVAWMRREAPRSAFVTNLARGGTATPFAADHAWGELAIDAASALNLDIAGVDLIDSSRGPLVLEVNSVPGFRGIQQHTRVDVCDAIARHVRAAIDLGEELSAR